MQRIHNKNKEEHDGTTQKLKETNPQKLILLLRCTKAMPTGSLHHSEQEEQNGTTPTQQRPKPSKRHLEHNFFKYQINNLCQITVAIPVRQTTQSMFPFKLGVQCSPF